MSYLIDVDPKQNLVLRKACLKLYPELGVVSQQEVVFLVKAFDYCYKPFRRYNEQDRVRRAILDVWNDNNPKLLADIESGDPNKRINVAIRAYKALQYNSKEELVNSYQRKIDLLQSDLEVATGPKEISNILSSISELRKRILELENEISEQLINEGQLKGDQEMGYLEILQANSALYETIRNTKPKRNANADT